MSQNQFRAEKSEAQYRKTDRSGSSGQQSSYSGGAGRGGSETARPPSYSSTHLSSSSFSGNRSYLVCCMFEEALSLASSILRHICDSDAPIDEIQLHDIMESAGMVIVQSLKKLGRTPEILDELRDLFGSVTAIPIQVILTGACFQISESSFSALQEFLVEFLRKWRYMDGQAGPFGAHYERCDGRSVLEVDRYLEVVELYTVTLLGMVLNETDVAISWLEKAELPEAKRQELLRRLHSLYSLTVTKSSQAGDSPLLAEVNEAHAAFGKERTISEVDVSLRSSKSPNGIEKKQGQAILKLSERIHPCFWWFRTVNLKFGNARLVLTHGKIVLWSSFIIFIYYVLRKKRDTLKLIVSRQASSVKKALVDMWHLAFSVQVNPLAAVQPLPVATQRSRS